MIDFDRAAAATNVSYVMVKGVTDAFNNQLKDKAEPKGIKAHFIMDDSGILTLNSIEAVFEKNVTVEVEKEESTLSKIGSTLSKLFSGKFIIHSFSSVVEKPKVFVLDKLNNVRTKVLSFFYCTVI